jgi:RimJ/RimL family protein N-acetyltransferase
VRLGNTSQYPCGDEVIEMTIQALLQPTPEQRHAAKETLPLAVTDWEVDLPLYGGGAVQVRAIRPDDTERLRAFHRQLSPESITFRFFRYMPELSLEEAERFTHVDYEQRMALVATSSSGEAEKILGVVRYEHIRPATAEVAFVVADHWQGHGIATALLHRLADYARERGYTTFVAMTMGSNTRMMEVLRNSGFPWTSHYATGEVEVRLDITRPPAAP